MKRMMQYLKRLIVRLIKCRMVSWYTTIFVLVLSVPLSQGMVRAELPLPKLNHKMMLLDKSITVPDFSLEDMDAKRYALEDYRGKVVMVNFWATWCPPCRREIPSMEALYQVFKEKSFTILAINQWESPDQVFAFMGQFDVFPNFPILFDRDSSVSQAFSVRGLPTTVLIDKQGRIVYRAVGGRDFNHPEIMGIVQELIAASVENWVWS